MLNFRGRSLPLCFRPERLGGDRPFALDCCNCCRNVSAAQFPLFLSEWSVALYDHEHENIRKKFALSCVSSGP